MKTYEVVTGQTGTAYSGNDANLANAVFDSKVESLARYTRDTVSLLENGIVIREKGRDISQTDV